MALAGCCDSQLGMMLREGAWACVAVLSRCRQGVHSPLSEALAARVRARP